MVPGLGVQELGLCVTYGPRVTSEVRQHIDAELAMLIHQYNTEPNRYRLQSCTNPETSSLRLHIQHTELVTSNKNTAGILVSAVGLTLVPIAMVAAELPFLLFFYYFPKDMSVIQASLSPDIGQTGRDRIERLCQSPGFLLKMEKQYDKHGVAFRNFVERILMEMEREESKNSRRMVSK
ncbi:MAG: hypothetical protein WBA23_17055 [Tunicatimonas sp.]|uniref:hypothetical protein n=1 Tax=Tunicatimonas sp. TaxID=1940096 RepID=UPI003C78EBBA